MKPTKFKNNVLSQVITNIPAYLVSSLATKHGIDKQARTFTPWSHVVAMIYAHLTHAMSLNDVCDSLAYHEGALKSLRGATPPSRNGLSHANKTRDAEFIKDVFYSVLDRFTRMYPCFGRMDISFKLPRGLKRMVNIVDSTTIPLFMNCMNWAKHRKKKAAAKMHMMLNALTFLPKIAVIRSAKSSDPVVGRTLCNALQAGEIVVFDKAYVDFKHLFELQQRGVLWITRAKENMSYRVVEELEVTNKSIIRDVKIKLCVKASKSQYPECFRLIIADVVRNGKTVRMEFITNDFNLAASTIADLYKQRWDIELFFKQIKQTLKLSDFLGYSENAVQWQLWTALLCYIILRFIAFMNKWKSTFARLFTIIRGVIWNYFDLRVLLESCGTARERKRLTIPPEQLYLPLFAA